VGHGPPFSQKSEGEIGRYSDYSNGELGCLGGKIWRTAGVRNLARRRVVKLRHSRFIGMP
jgi:hypothetical protein